MVLLAGHAPARSYSANEYPFRPASTYTYFGGPPIQDAILVIEPSSDGDAGCTLLRPKNDPDDAVWMGLAPTDEELAAAAGLDPSHIQDADQLVRVLAGRGAAGVCPPFPRAIELMRNAGLEQPGNDELTQIVNMRLIKDEHEVAAMRRAAEVAVSAHRAAMSATLPGRNEADVAAAFDAVLVANNCAESFTPIVTIAGHTLHAQGFTNRLEAGRLLLVDAGAQGPSGYTSDITRTYPVDGKWSPVQRHLYDTVLAAQQAAIAACVPGRRFRDVHDLAAEKICEGLVRAELLAGDPAELAARCVHTLFFCHGLGHLIGLDVHDMEDFGDLAGYAPGRSRRPEFGSKFLRLDRDLEPGYCVTIEPGIYLNPEIWKRDDLVGPFADVVNRSKVDALLAEHFGGIRIEEDVHVRAEPQGPEILNSELPNDADAVSALLGT
jgi:Xaa-Pro aminopeptidase